VSTSREISTQLLRAALEPPAEVQHEALDDLLAAIREWLAAAGGGAADRQEEGLRALDFLLGAVSEAQPTIDEMGGDDDAAAPADPVAGVRWMAGALRGFAAALTVTGDGWRAAGLLRLFAALELNATDLGALAAWCSALIEHEPVGAVPAVTDALMLAAEAGAEVHAAVAQARRALEANVQEWSV
jgi:hypothetical protein